MSAGTEASLSFFYRPEHIGPLPIELDNIDTRRTRIGSVNPREVASEQTQTALYNTVGAVDATLEAMAAKLPVDRDGTTFPDGSMVRLKFSEKAVARHGQAYATSATMTWGFTKKWDINVEQAYPMAGAFQLLDADLKKDGEGWNNGRGYYPLEIGGTIMTATGYATVNKPLPQGFITAQYAVLREDMGDTIISGLRAAYGRSQDENIIKLIKRIQDKRSEGATFDDLASEYHDAAVFGRDAKLAFHFRYCKNKPFYDALEELAYQSGDEAWNTLQRIGLISTVLVREKEWVMGGGKEHGLLDTPVYFRPKKSGDSHILQYVPDQYHDRIAAEGYDKHYLRIGAGIKGLVVFDPSRYDDLVHLVADEFTRTVLE